MSLTDPSRQTLKLLAILFLALAGGIAAAGHLYSVRQEEAFQRATWADLSAIADMKVRQIVAWKQERIQDAKMIAAAAELLPAVRRVLEHPRDPQALVQLRTWLQACQQAGYANAVLVNGQGQIIASLGHTGTREVYAELSRGAIRTGDVVFTDFHRDAGLTGVHLGLLIPLLKNGRGSPEGTLLLGIDPNQFLYPLIQNWPTPSKTAETLLVRREGDQVVYLNELRHRKGTALTLRLPLSQDMLPASVAAAGRETVLSGIDYRGIPVLAATRTVPNSPWFLVAKVDTAETDVALRRQGMLLAFVVISLIAATGSGVAFLWRQQQSRFYKQQYESEIERRALLGHYDYLSRYANDMILLLDESGRVIEANNRALSTYGYDRSELIGRHVTDLRDPDSLVDFETQWRLVGDQEGLVFEARHRRKDGTLFPVEVSARVIDVEGSKFRQSIIRDITDRKRAEDSLRKSEARLERAQRIASLGIWEATVASLLGESPEAYYWSDEVYRIFGVSKEGFPPNRASFYTRVHPDDRERVSAAMSASIATGKAYKLDHRIVRPEGTLRYVREHAELQSEVSGRARMIGTIQDITEHKQLENQFLQAQRLESIGRLAGGVAHDFNNLLTVIGGYADLVASSLASDDPLLSSMEEIAKAAGRATALTQQLLVFSRRQVVQPKVLNLNLVVRDTEKMLGRLLGDDIELITRLSATHDVVADPNQINQALMNLAVNARDAMPQGGKLVLETRDSDFNEEVLGRHPELVGGRYVSLVVSDTGSGMDENTRGHLFEPFFTTKEQGKGTGLGLSTVYGIVKQAGGHLWVYSEPGMGATFHICLPRVESAAPAAEPPRPTAADLRGTETILVVEDQAELRQLAVKVLAGYGYRVLQAGTGKDAMQVSSSYDGPVHLLLTDLVMPGMTGRDLADRLRESRAGMKVLYMSGYADTSSGVLEPGIAYLQKPFSPQALALKTREILAGSA